MRADSRLLTGLALVSGAWGRVKYLGVAIPGIDFGCAIDGTCPVSTVTLPRTSLGGGDGEGQMKHFVEDDGMNIFRLRVATSWQFMLNGHLGGKLDATNSDKYDKLVQACLGTGAYCMIDLHNFARWDGDIVGQGGSVKDDDLVDVWQQLAVKYAKNDKIVFGVMNEPHDLDIQLWAQTCQKVVTAIRKAGAKSNIILLPGTNFASAETFVSTGSAVALANVTNPDGTTDNLLLDLHKYLDINNSGMHAECTTDNVEVFRTIATWLRTNKRAAMISESGASMDPTCMDRFCTQNNFISQNSDVFAGFIGWGAGSFDSSYVMSLTPSGSAGSYTDNKLMKQCIIGPFIKNAAPETTSSSSSPASTSTGSSTTTRQILQETSTPSDPIETSANSSHSENGGSGCTPSVGPLAGGLIFAAVALFHSWQRFL
ncbi:Endoglucanase EG-II [Tolypocladium ophioglossoides CBS 100239]|uniref:Endoglucanase EG-II n=1 Tax=Tolypocladium ophioglossoides (strain CBS 100239) TaxID=1163406 RepID=A0A0L0NEL1_TOLOC|nr:Endoglucanase EG-II [Tolypocladium ophioglossoides CBS 100239]